MARRYHERRRLHEINHYHPWQRLPASATIALMRVEFYFDFSCPYAYIAASRIEAVAAAAGAELIWRPMLLGGVFRGTGLADSPTTVMGAAKSRHNGLDMHRWADHYQVPLRMPAAHPMRTVRALRALLSLPEAAWPAVIHGMYRAYWQRGEDISSADTVRAVLEEAGVSAAAVDAALAANDDPAAKEALQGRTDEALSRGVFGAPTMFVLAPGLTEPLMFWGQDRLHMVEAALAGWTPDSQAWAGPPASPATGASPAAGAADGGAGCEPATLCFWYDFSSPFAYLGSTQIEAMAARAGARLVWRPMLLGALFREIGTANVPLFAMPEAKRRYQARELQYWSSYWRVPFRFASRFPMKTVTALRLALLAGDRIAELSHALFRVLWVEDGDLNDHATLARVLTEHGFAADEMLAHSQEPASKQALIDSTAEAVAAGVFGAPTMIITAPGISTPDGTMLLWGQDRLGMAEAVLRGFRPRTL